MLVDYFLLMVRSLRLIAASLCGGSLEELALPLCDSAELTDEGMSELIHMCPHLISLDVTGCVQLDGTASPHVHFSLR